MRIVYFQGLILFLFLSLTSCDTEPQDTLKREPVDGIRIAWDYGTLSRIAPRPGSNPAYCGYSRMIQLQDGRLACVYETSNGTVEIVFSSDTAKTWTQATVLFTTENNIPPYVPSVLQLDDGSLLVACNTRPREPYTSDRKFGIKVRKSEDKGATWMEDQILYEAQSEFHDGCWEPAMLQLPDGEVQLYFSNEGIYTSSNEQNISILRSSDLGETWTNDPEIVGFREGRRDGMPVPLLLADRSEILVSIEDNKEGEFKPSIYREKISDNWKDGLVGADDSRRSYHPLSDPFLLNTYAGGPYLNRLHTGEVILSYQTTYNRKNIWDRSSMAVEIGDERGELFSRRSVPFKVAVEKWGLWNSLAVVGDNIPIALTSTNAYSTGNTEVWMIKGHIIPEFEISNGTLVIDGKPEEKCWSEDFPYFVGGLGPASLRATLCADEEMIYLAAEITDPELLVSDDFETSDGIILQLDPKREGYELPMKDIYAFQILPGGNFQVLEGDGEDWTVSNIKGTILCKTSTIENTTYFEMAIPLDMLSIESIAEYKIGINFVLKNKNVNGDTISESISSNDALQPYTWCPLTIKSR